MNLKQVVVNGEKLNVGGSSTSPTPPSESLLIGSVILWAGTLETIPTGWHLCNGEDGTIDLCGMFALGAGGTYSLGDEGGSEEVTLIEAQMPGHSHSATYYSGGGGTNIFEKSTSSDYWMKYSSSANAVSNRTSSVGGSQPHPNMPPYKALYYIQKIA